MGDAGEVVVVLLAAGAGARFGAGRPKALALLAGTPLVRRAAENLLGLPGLSRLVVVTPSGVPGADVAAAVRGVHPDLVCVPGGERRRDSVQRGLDAAGHAGWIVVHDAARPLASPELAARVLQAAQRSGAAVPGAPVTDTLVSESGGHVGQEVPRGGVHAIQTPQAFARDVLVEAHRRADPHWDAPDDGTMVRANGGSVALVLGEADNIKITWPEDLARAAALLAARAPGGTPMTTRVGLGWDVHPLVAGRPTILAGVVVMQARGPAGHSDGDPLAHAVCDALLGAAALGDIGVLFPDSDPRWEGAPGKDLLAATAAALRARGWRPRQVDAVLIADEPRLAPHRDAIRAGLAAALGVPVEAVSVKGKRTEGLGGLAGGAGIACHALAVVERVLEDSR